ncbi:sialidase [Acinetobacter baumannii]|uniref:exo-alpha-sialidase n=1 Tax=Acinetobacter baumannii TaxID=470 RepID=UPI000DE5E2E1|nr:sialidase family protein [Acinetobacter baumannii]SSV06519.1 sialidase [Acinetobacter baumannii]SSV58252.1 sialidase [Acinetobacter baumannii]SSV63098.1 sialidase [Acinetobacter baumannii]SSV68521.1 sialidase [Acinetobacter baumannii]
MSVPEQTPFIEYTANGTTTVFPVPFQCDKAEYLIVKVNDLIQLLGTWSFIDGSVVFNTAPLNESIVTIQRSTKLSRTTDYSLYDNSFRPEPVNYDFDNIWRVLQEVAYQFTIAENKFQDLIDQLVEGNINGLPAEILARIAGDEANGQLISQEIARAFFAEQELNQLISANQVDLMNRVAEEKNRAISVEQSLQNQISTADAGIKYFSTEAEVFAFVPAASDPKQAYAFDTKKNYLWKLKSGSTTEYEWKDEGVSQLDQAKKYTDEKAKFETGSDDIAILKDVNGKTVFVIKKSGKFYILGLPNDIASTINFLYTLIGTSTTSNLIELTDKNGVKTLIQNAKGDLILPNVGNLTLALKALKNDVSSQNSLNLPAAHLSGKYADDVLTETMADFEHTDYLLKASDVNALNIFPHAVTMLRIPAITRIGKSKYLLFFEARESVDDFGKNSQGVATITVDEATGVASISNVQCLHAAFTDSENKLRTFMNACAVKLDSGRIICLYVRRYGTTEHQLYKRYSDDDGLTWSNYEDITSVKGSTGWNLLCPCSQGLVKRYGQHKGRIVFPLWTSGTGYATSAFRAGYVYSDDNGTTWHLGEFADYTTANEVQCAEDLNGDMLFSIRLENATTPKILARHSDVTKKYATVLTNKALTSATVMSGLIQSANKYDKSANKFQLSVCRTMSRTDLLIHTSYDGGETWRTHLLPSTAGTGVAYSCIENISASKKFLMWEADATVNFKYAVVALSNLVNEVN